MTFKPRRKPNRIKKKQNNRKEGKKRIFPGNNSQFFVILIPIPFIYYPLQKLKGKNKKNYKKNCRLFIILEALSEHSTNNIRTQSYIIIIRIS